MSQGAYPPGGYEPADPMPPRPEDGPDVPPATRATARVPQPPVWAPPQTPQPPPFGGPPPSTPPPPHGVYGGGSSGGFGGAPVPQPPSSAPPGGPGTASSGRASVPVPGTPTFSPGTYGAPAPSSGATPPPPYPGPEPGRFANLRYDDPVVEPRPKSKRGLIIGIVVAAVVVLALAGAGVFMFLNKTSNTATFAVNSCVKKSDDKAVAVSCTETGAYQIVSKVDTVDKCPDKGQPYVVLSESGKSEQVLCLKPAH
jgi:hypothetical protein